MLKKITLLAACAASAFAMNSADININNEDLEFGVRFDIGQFNENVEPETMLIGARYLHGSEENSDVRDINDYYELSFLIQNQMDNEDLVIGLGLKVNATEDFSSVPLGVEASYKLPIDTTIPVYVNGMLYYAPSVLTMQDADGYLEYRANVEFEIIENARITAGYRVMKTDYDDNRGDIEYNKSVYLGFKFAF
jgi:hypothetical protein